VGAAHIAGPEQYRRNATGVHQVAHI
jgi:hypothetical protein